MGKTDFESQRALSLNRLKAEEELMPAYQQSTKDAQAGAQQAGAQQLANNRLNTSNPFASQTFNPDGSVSQQFKGGMGQAFGGLQNQIAGLGQGMDWSQFAPLGNGDQARQQAFDASYGQSTSRLDPMWNQRENQARTRLLNQGLAEDSEAYKNAMGDLSRDRNDAYTSALNMAQGQATSAGDSVFRNNMGARQQAIQEALKRRGMPMEEMQGLQGFLSGQPTYNADNSTLASGLASGQMGVQGAQGLFGMNQQQFNNRFSQMTGQQAQDAGTAQGAMSGAAAFLPFLMSLSDERLKENVRRLPFEAIPGVAVAQWTWPGSDEVQTGVIAQDLAAVRPDLVWVRPDGFLMVDYGGLRGGK